MQRPLHREKDGRRVRRARLHEGHATIAFEYRIVAKPLHLDGERLARVSASDTTGARIGGPGIKPEQLPLPLSPEQRLKNRIGTEAYAKHMLTLKNKLTAP